jgi:hypothetical protein
MRVIPIFMIHMAQELPSSTAFAQYIQNIYYVSAQWQAATTCCKQQMSTNQLQACSPLSFKPAATLLLQLPVCVRCPAEPSVPAAVSRQLPPLLLHCCFLHVHRGC